MVSGVGKEESQPRNQVRGSWASGSARTRWRRSVLLLGQAAHQGGVGRRAGRAVIGHWDNEEE